MSKFTQKAWTSTTEALRQLQTICQAKGNLNASAGIRYCIQFTYDALNQAGVERKGA